MGIKETVILSFIQGVSEFLPISSSGHLIIFHHFFSTSEGSLAFDVALHLGTVLAIMIYFFKDIANMLNDLIPFILLKNRQPRLLFQMVFAMIPTAIVGVIIVAFNLESYIRIIPVVAINMIVFGIILYFCDKVGKQNISLYEISKKQAFLVGIAQSLALVPGVSRAGACLSMSRFLGVEKVSAVKFSMLISIPAILGAGLLSFVSNIDAEAFIFEEFFLGIFLSFVVGLVVIKGLIEFIKRFSFKVFMIYRIILGITLLVIYFSL